MLVTWPACTHGGQYYLFDDNYRRAQVGNNLRWGSDFPHVERICLKHGDTKAQQETKFPEQTKCKQCTYGATCRFRHVYSAPYCGKPYTLIEYNTQGQGGGNRPRLNHIKVEVGGNMSGDLKLSVWEKEIVVNQMRNFFNQEAAGGLQGN